MFLNLIALDESLMIYSFSYTLFDVKKYARI